MAVIAIASDHGGFELKQAVAKVLSDEGYEIVDIGPNDNEPVDYPIYGKACARAILEGKAQKGIVICGTGIGISIAANRYKGIRCALVHSEEYAKLAAEHNDANMIALGGRFTETEDAVRYIKAWLNTPFGEGRHSRRVAELDED